VRLRDRQVDGNADRAGPGRTPRGNRAGELIARSTEEATTMADDIDATRLQALAAAAISQPLVTHIYTADPSAHVFEGAIYVYPSHDIEAGIAFNDLGDHFAMEDYHVLRMDSPESEAVDCGVALHVRDVPWAQRQLWAPDAACRDGRYYLYFPAKRADGIFQIGVAAGERPEGPFAAEPEPIPGSYS